MNQQLTDSQSHLEFAGMLLRDAKAAKTAQEAGSLIELARKELLLANEEIENAQVHAFVQKVGRTRHALTRLRGLLSYGQAHGGLPADETELLSILREMPAFSTGDKITEQDLNAIAWFSRQEDRIFSLADAALQRRSKSYATL